MKTDDKGFTIVESLVSVMLTLIIGALMSAFVYVSVNWTIRGLSNFRQTVEILQFSKSFDTALGLLVYPFWEKGEFTIDEGELKLPFYSADPEKTVELRHIDDRLELNYGDARVILNHVRGIRVEAIHSKEGERGLLLFVTMDEKELEFSGVFGGGIIH